MLFWFSGRSVEFKLTSKIGLRVYENTVVTVYAIVWVVHVLASLTDDEYVGGWVATGQRVGGTFRPFLTYIFGPWRAWWWSWSQYQLFFLMTILEYKRWRGISRALKAKSNVWRLRTDSQKVHFRWDVECQEESHLNRVWAWSGRSEWLYIVFICVCNFFIYIFIISANRPYVQWYRSSNSCRMCALYYS